MRLFHKLNLFVILSFAILALSLSPNNGIYNVTEENYDEFFKEAKSKNAAILMTFTSSSCKHCDVFKPKLYSAAERLMQDEDGIYYIGEVGGDDNFNLCEHYDVRVYPSLFTLSPLLEYGAEKQDTRDTSAELIYQLAQKSAYYQINHLTYDQYLQRREVLQESFVLGILEMGKESELNTQFQNAHLQFPNLRFYELENSLENLSQFGFNELTEKILIIRNPYLTTKRDQQYIEYNPDDFQNIHSFILSEFPAPLEFCTEKMKEFYRRRNLPLGAIMTEIDLEHNPKPLKYLSNRAKKIALSFKHDLDFCLYHTDNSNPFIKRLDISSPTLYILSNTSRNKYRLNNLICPETQEFASSQMHAFISEFLENKLKPYIKSQPTPKVRFEDVTVDVTGDSFNGIVNNEEKHVFLRITGENYELRSLKQDWLELANDDEVVQRNDIVVAVVDYNLNDLPYPYDQMGTFVPLYLVTKKGKDRPVRYNGKKGSENLKEWMFEKIREEEMYGYVSDVEFNEYKYKVNF